MSGSFFDSPLCMLRIACSKCRRSIQYRKGIAGEFNPPATEDFDCPFGLTVETVPEIPEYSFPTAGKGPCAHRKAARTEERVCCGGRKKIRVVYECELKKVLACNGCSEWKASSTASIANRG